MVVVCSVKLFLNDENRIVSQIPSNEIEREATDWMLGLLEFEVDPHCLGQMIGMVEEPRSEVPSFVLPDRSNVNSFQTSKIHFFSVVIVKLARHTYRSSSRIAARMSATLGLRVPDQVDRITHPPDRLTTDPRCSQETFASRPMQLSSSVRWSEQVLFQEVGQTTLTRCNRTRSNRRRIKTFWCREAVVVADSGG